VVQGWDKAAQMGMRILKGFWGVRGLWALFKNFSFFRLSSASEMIIIIMVPRVDISGNRVMKHDRVMIHDRYLKAVLKVYQTPK
jgi:hypothetical protein